MNTKKPSAIVYGWHQLGEFVLTSEIYWEEGLLDEVFVYSLPYNNSVSEDYTKYKPDLVISFGEEVSIEDLYIQNFHIHYDDLLDDVVLANVIVCQTVFRDTDYQRPRFSIFTPTYKTGERILRTYAGLAQQTLNNWEWVVVDDSPDEETWELLREIANKDYRVKIHRIYPLSGGNIGLAKHRAAMLCDGDWVIELDHDDTLAKTALEVCDRAAQQYPDAGFIYSNCCERYDDGEMKYYDHDWTGNWYGREDNFFDFGYAGHSWEEVDGEMLLAHHYPDVNPLTIRFNISMPNHLRAWERNLYHKIGGHNKETPVADDLEIIIRTFLHTRFIHIKKVLYLQFNNRNSTVDNMATDINRRARLIRDRYDKRIHERILELGFEDWNWDYENDQSIRKFQNQGGPRMLYEDEQVMNYIYEEN